MTDTPNPYERAEQQPQQILDRIPPVWLKSVDTPADWFPILEALDAEIAEIIPDYSVYQVKEKFWGLRYYIGYPQPAQEDGRGKRAEEIISKYERCIDTHVSQQRDRHQENME